MEQRTDEWFAARLGKVTASNIAKVMAKGGGATRKNYMAQLVCETLTGQKEETFKSASMERGNELEAVAREIVLPQRIRCHSNGNRLYSAPHH